MALRYGEAAAGNPPVATEQVGADHYQLVKLIDPTAASAAGIGNAANPMSVSGTVTATGPLTDAQLRATPVPVSGTVGLSAGTNNIGDVDVLTVPAPLSTSGGGTELASLRVTLANDSTGLVSVDDNGGSLTIDGTVTANAGTGTFTVAGSVAHDAVQSGNPVSNGAVAETPEDTAPVNQVSAEGDAVRLAASRDGALYTHPHPPRIWHVLSEFTTAQTDTVAKAAPGAGLSLYITDINCHCNGAVTVTIEEGTTVLKWRYYAAGAGDGSAPSFTTPIKITANTAITVTTSAAVTVFLLVAGYTAP